MAEKKFNFGEAPLIQQTEQTVQNGIDQIEQGGAEPQREQQEVDVKPTSQPDEEDTKGIQAYIPMSLYERLLMQKLRTKQTLGSMFVQAIRFWLDAQESKK